MKIIIAIVLLATIVLALFIYGKLQTNCQIFFNNNTNIGYYIESPERRNKTGSLSKRITTYWLSYTDEKIRTLFLVKRDEVEAKCKITNEQGKLVLRNSPSF